MSNDATLTSPRPAARAGTTRGTILTAAGLALAALLGASGCTASLAAEPAVVAYDDAYYEPDLVTVPADIYAYPHMYYGGNYVYLVDGRWVYPSARGWRVYRSEPVELRRYREHVYASPREGVVRRERVVPREYRVEPRVNAYPTVRVQRR